MRWECCGCVLWSWKHQDTVAWQCSFSSPACTARCYVREPTVYVHWDEGWESWSHYPVEWKSSKWLHKERELSTVFFSTFDVDKLGKIRRYHWKKSLKISKIAKFESDLLKTNDEIATHKREILNTFFCSGGGGGAPHHSNVYKCSQLSGAISPLA